MVRSNDSCLVTRISSLGDFLTAVRKLWQDHFSIYEWERQFMIQGNSLTDKINRPDYDIGVVYIWLLIQKYPINPNKLYNIDNLIIDSL